MPDWASDGTQRDLRVLMQMEGQAPSRKRGYPISLSLRPPAAILCIRSSLWSRLSLSVPCLIRIRRLFLKSVAELLRPRRDHGECQCRPRYGGASVSEIMGSGSAATPNQKFNLKQSPLTYRPIAHADRQAEHAAGDGQRCKVERGAEALRARAGEAGLRHAESAGGGTTVHLWRRRRRRDASHGAEQYPCELPRRFGSWQAMSPQAPSPR